MAEKRRILVVEDEAPVRELVARHLVKQGYEVAEASDAEEVLLQMSRDRVPFDLVLSDIHLPGLSGVELLRLLLTHSPLRPVIMITGDSDEGLARRALGYGAAGYLLKPFQLLELDATVRQAMARLELVEAAESLARDAAGDAQDGGIPTAWLELADARSTAGAGHGSRVARLAGAITSALPDRVDAGEGEALDLAARAHELGRLLGPASSPAELATRTGQLLYDLGVESRVLRLINNVRERWNGSGGPNGIQGKDIPACSLVLAAADALDHAAVVHLEAGLEPGESMGRALEEVRGTAPTHYGTDVAAAIDAAAGVVEAIWVLARGGRAEPRQAIDQG